MQVLIDMARPIEIDPVMAHAFAGIDADALRVFDENDPAAIGVRLAGRALRIAACEGGLLRQVASAVEMVFGEVLDADRQPWRFGAERQLAAIGACASYDTLDQHRKDAMTLADERDFDDDELMFQAVLADCLDTILQVRGHYVIRRWDAPGVCDLCWRVAPEGKGRRRLCAEHAGPHRIAARKKQLRIRQHFADRLRQPAHDEIVRRELVIRKTLRQRGLFQVERLDAGQLESVRVLMPLVFAANEDVATAARRLDPHADRHPTIMRRFGTALVIGDGAALFFLARAQAWISTEAEREADAVQARRGPRQRWQAGG
jgi:hypothetical protein